MVSDKSGSIFEDRRIVERRKKEKKVDSDRRAGERRETEAKSKK